MLHPRGYLSPLLGRTRHVNRSPHIAVANLVERNPSVVSQIPTLIDVPTSLPVDITSSKAVSEHHRSEPIVEEQPMEDIQPNDLDPESDADEPAANPQAVGEKAASVPAVSTTPEASPPARSDIRNIRAPTVYVPRNPIPVLPNRQTLLAKSAQLGSASTRPTTVPTSLPRAQNPFPSTQLPSPNPLPRQSSLSIKPQARTFASAQLNVSTSSRTTT